jgi:transposase
MNPVVGLDVAKGESQVQAFLDKKKPYKSSFKVAHTIEGLETLLHFLREIEDKTGVKPPIVLESTGHYHTPTNHPPFLKNDNNLCDKMTFTFR